MGAGGRVGKRQWYIRGEAHAGRIIVVRLAPGSDLIVGLKHVCDELSVRAGVVCSLIGSLQSAKLFLVKHRGEAAHWYCYSAPTLIPGPLELVAAQGTIGRNEGNEVSLHLHACLFDSSGRAYGGHLAEEGNTVAVTAEAFLMETASIRLIRQLDPHLGFALFNPEPCEEGTLDHT